MFRRHIDEYGFDRVELKAADGGSVRITYFANSVTDIALISIQNGSGLGYSDYVRSVDDVERNITSVNGISWITIEDKQLLTDFFVYIKNETRKQLKVRARFDVSKGYSEGKIDYTFTEKTPEGSSLPTKVEIKVSIPSEWSLDNAWSAFFKLLNPDLKSFSEQENSNAN